MDDQLLKILACPVCKNPLFRAGDRLKCGNNGCNSEFSTLNGKPVLVNTQNSVFRPKEINRQGRRTAKQRIRDTCEWVVPSLTHNWAAARNFTKLASLLSSNGDVPTVLVVGGGELGVGIDELIKVRKIRIIETDVYFSKRIHLIADGHDLPFLDNSLDAVIIQAVLEHVLDPHRCVAETYRVLKGGGLIYAETPFMYPVHLGAYDFTRFSMSGHRRLMRNFAEIDAGVAGGPGQALAVSMRSFFLSVSTSALTQGFATIILPFFTFWLKYCDYFLVSKPHAADFASTVFFLGRKQDNAIPDDEIIKGHWSTRFVRSATSGDV